MDLDPAVSTGETPPSRYAAYLNSPEWRRTRNRALKTAGFACARCSSRRSLEVHHRTYVRLGCEQDRDLEVLCVMCHRGEHVTNPDQTSLGVYLKIASAALKREPFATIADLADMVKTACAKLKIPAPPDRVNAALAVLVANRLKMPRAVRPTSPFDADRGAPIEKGDARELLIRLFAKAEAPLAIRQMRASTRRAVMDIDGPIPRDEWGEA